MKKLLIIVLVLILSCVPIYATALDDYISSAPDVRIVAEEVSPEPVEPGQDVTVKVRIYNNGGATAENVNVKLNAQYPFYLKTESQDFKEYENLCVGCSKDNSYYLVVDADAISGIYPIKFTAYIDDEFKVEREVNIRVTGLPDIIFESEDIDGLVKSGDVFSSEINLTNIGTGKARNIKIITQSTDFISLGSGLQIIDELEPDQSTKTLLEFSVGEDVEPDSYNIPIQFTFSDENGMAHNFTENLGIKLANYGEVYLQNWKLMPSRVDVGEEFTIQIRVENIGTGDAKNVKAVLETPMKGTKETYIGRLEKDDDAPGVFTLTARAPGTVLNKLIISYTDDFGDHEVVEEFSFNVGITSTPVGLIIAFIVIVVLVVVGYFLFFRKKEEK
ncbi:hypothetical protein KY339_02515 [Candidatus Woesearchaeota archaeon]|nr:hypothetical protein [Candidatus Woesearchaeota archaeon]